MFCYPRDRSAIRKATHPDGYAGKTSRLGVASREARTGIRLRIVSIEGPQVADLNLWNSHDLIERFYSGKTRALHGDTSQHW